MTKAIFRRRLGVTKLSSGNVDFLDCWCLVSRALLDVRAYMTFVNVDLFYFGVSGALTGVCGMCDLICIVFMMKVIVCVLCNSGMWICWVSLEHYKCARAS